MKPKPLKDKRHSRMDDDLLKELGSVFIGILLIGAIIEVGILIYAYVNADEVECNWLWCTFTDIREQRYSEECYVNGVQVNCSEYKEEFPDYASHGWNSVNGICPGWKENKSIVECMQEVKGNSSQT